jgi:hypothetical protein
MQMIVPRVLSLRYVEIRENVTDFSHRYGERSIQPDTAKDMEPLRALLQEVIPMRVVRVPITTAFVQL